MRPDSALRCALLAAALTATPAYAWQDTPFAEGKAYDRESGQLLYSEQHLCHISGDACSVHYFDPTGVLIASKKLDYRNSATSPALTIRDYRNGKKLTVEPADADVVVDAGFDNFVREQWDVLDVGDPIRFRFQVTGFDSPLDMNIARSEETGCAGEELCLQVSIDSWLIGVFVGPIELSYSRSDRKLRRYSGISNIRDGGGELMDVDIFYEYGDPAIAPEKSDALVYQL